MFVLAVAIVALTSACDYFDTTAVKNKADNERKLKELQWALLIPSSSPPAVPALPAEAGIPANPDTSNETGTAAPPHEAEQPAGEAPASEPTAPSSEAHAADVPAPEHTPAASTPPEAAGMNLEGDERTGADGTPVSVEHDPAKAVPTTLAVLAVVDNFTLLPVDENEDPAEHAKKLDLAQRRERVVRQELQNVLVANSLITVVQPNEAQIAQARAEIAATNSAAISNSMLPGLAETLGVQHVVTALIDLEGGEVNIVAEHAPDGTIVFQDTLVEWEPVVAIAKEAEKEAKAAAK